MMSKMPEYCDRVVVFIDILGFSALVASLDTNPKLHELIHWSLSQIKSHKLNSEINDTSTCRFEVSCFSDSIVMSSNEYDLAGLVWASGWLQIQLLRNGILTRGGISKGKTIHSNDILYGEGMLKAYHIESKVAVYPRIVLDPQPIFQTDKKNIFPLTFFKQDTDGLNYVDPFSFPGSIGRSCPAVCEMFGCDPTNKKSSGCRSHGLLDGLKKHIDGAISQEKNVGRLAKWNWLKTKYDAAQKEYSKSKKKKAKKK